MANDLNQCNFIGRLGTEPEVKYMPSGDAVANIRIACGWKGKDKEGVEWVPVVFFGRLAEIAGQYLTKGSQVYVSGRYRTRKFKGQDGQDRYTTEIVANDMQMLGGRGGGGGDSYGGGGRNDYGGGGGGRTAPRGGGGGAPGGGGGPSPMDDFDDIPF